MESPFERIGGNVWRTKTQTRVCPNGAESSMLKGHTFLEACFNVTAELKTSGLEALRQVLGVT